MSVALSLEHRPADRPVQPLPGHAKQAFALRVSGEEVYARETADALEAALRPLVGGGLVARMSRHDTNPANNLAVPAEHRS